MQKEQGRKEKAPGAQPEAKSQTKKPQHNGEAAQKQEAPFANVQHYLAPLCAQKRWVVWRLEKVKGKLTKVPYQGHNPKRKAATNDLATWCDYSTAVATVSQGGFSGIGYCLKDNETAAIDCDDCRNKETGALDPYVQELVTRCNSYTEITPSEEGLRIIGIGLGEKVHNKFQVGNGVQIEPYRKATRYITITGNLLPTGPTQLNNIDEHIDALVADFDKKQDDEQPHAQPEDTDDLLWRLVKGGCAGTEYARHRARGVFYVACEMLRRGYLADRIIVTLLDRNHGISEHCYDQANPERAARRAVTSAASEMTIACDEEGNVYKTQDNIHVALHKMGVTVRYDEFADNIKVSGLDGFGPLLTDAAVTRLRLAMGQRFRLYCAKEFAQDVIDDTAHLNRFHPVRDWLSALQWDGVPRVDKWLVTYAQANDDAYVRAVGKLVLVAAVRRVFQPGCKFDEMLLLEQEQQGFNRSSALAILATRQEWFSDYLPLNASGKEVIENTRGKWIMEAAELVGMKRADVQQVKGFLSRRVDRARVAYGRIATDVARQFIVIGTTNQQDYLRDDTGNRRFWPVHTERFDLEALQRDVDQLWAEAAVMEKAGASIRLDPALWPKAAEEQAARTPDDPWREKIEITLGDYKRAKVTKETVWTILDVPTRDQGQQQAARLNRAMQLAGWHKPNAQGKIKVAGKVVPGWVRGKAGKGIVTLAATRTRDGLRVFDYATVQSMIEAAIANERRMLCESLGEEVGRLLAEERREAMRATRDELHMLKLEIAKLATESATLREALANERCRVAGVEPLTRRMN